MATGLLGWTSYYIMCKQKRLLNSNNVPGQERWNSFKARNPEVVLRKPEKLTTCRSRMMNRVVVDNYFTELKSRFENNHLSDITVWNCDATDKQFQHSSVYVLARKCSKSFPGRIANSRENITIPGCVNAAGHKMPTTMCIVKGKLPGL